MTIQAGRQVLLKTFGYCGFSDEALSVAGPVLGPDLFAAMEVFSQAARAGSRSSPNPAVGALLLGPESQILAAAATQFYGRKHAERQLLEGLPQILQTHGLNAREIELISTLEPCTHTGQQPPCSEIILQSGIKKVRYFCSDANPLVQVHRDEQHRKLQEAGVDLVHVPQYEPCVRYFLAPFFKSVKGGGLFWGLKWAQSLDGQLADDYGKSQWISGPKSREYVHRLRCRYDAILVGAGTWLQDKPQLSSRDHGYDSPEVSQPLRVIWDRQGATLQTNLESLQHESLKTIVLVQKNALTRIQIPKNLLIKEVEFSDGDLPFKIEEALRSKEVTEFRGKPLQSILVEGGATLLSLFFETQKFDLIHQFIAPVFLGGEHHRIRAHQKALSMASKLTLVLKHQRLLGEDTLLEMMHPKTNALITP